MAEERRELDVIVVDNGGGFIKVGYAGEDRPRVVIPAVLLDAGSQSIPAAAGSIASDPTKDYLVGEEALHALHTAHLTSSSMMTVPIERGEVHDWPAMEKIWEHIFTKELHIDSMEEYSVLLTNSASASKGSREKMAEIMFRKFKVPSICIVNSAVMSLFSTGRTTGVVLEVGNGIAHAVPVFEGFALPHATERLEVAGRDLTTLLMKMLSERLASKGIKFDQSHMDILRDIKEKLCATLPSAQSKPKSDEEEDPLYELPDGKTIRIDTDCRFGVTEALFDPSIIGVSHPGVHKLTAAAIDACDNYIKPELLKNVVLAGGTSMMTGFAERMKAELEALNTTGFQLDVIQDSQRRNASWIGASIYGSLPTYNQLKISRQEYLENEGVVHRKYF